MSLILLIENMEKGFIVLVLMLAFSIGCLGASRQKRAAICYDGLGCFSNTSPYNNTEGELPLDPSFIQTTFYHSTVNKLFPTKLVIGDIGRLERSRFNGSLPTKIIVHGFVQTGRVRWIRNMAKNFIRKAPMNVIAVDWGRGSGFPYRQAVANTRVVGAEVANLVHFLVRQTGADVSNFHIIGHSLGAHIAGYAGERIPGLHRITGLDPAGPNFQGTDPRVRLDPSDADFVDAIHTDGTQYETYSGYGTLEAVGDIDFYPNGGVNQPGCPLESWTEIMSESYTDGVFGTANDVSCSHSRSIHLFTESINSRCPFTSFPCPNKDQFDNGQCFSCGQQPCPSLGYNADQYQARGKHFLKTDDHPPFCGHTYFMKIKFGSAMEPQGGDLNLRILGSTGLSRPYTIHSGETQFRPNQEESVIVTSSSDLGATLQVQLEFRGQDGYFSSLWGSTSSVTIKMITVQPVESGTTLYFCGHDTAIQSGQPTGFHQSATTADACVTHQVNQA